jgi:HSP20 family protein
MTSQRDPFANFERMRRQIDELFGDFWERAGIATPHGMGFRPRVDVYYCGDPPMAVIKAELAGIEIGDVHLEARGRTLVISGERRSRDTEGRAYQQLEIETGAFERAVALGVDVDATQARATYENGILRVELPIVQPGQATRVPIAGPSQAHEREQEPNS